MNGREVLLNAKNEIESLRRNNELMRARIDMFDAVMSALHGQPATNREGAMHPDIAWELEKLIREIDKNQQEVE